MIKFCHVSDSGQFKTTQNLLEMMLLRAYQYNKMKFKRI